MNWDESYQLRHAAQCTRVRFLRDGQRGNILDLERELRELGYDGIIGSLSAERIVQLWKEKGWVEISPSGSELRLTNSGIEQFARWDEEDALWERGTTDEIEFAKRLKAGEPVVVRANFLIDAESNLQAALHAFVAPSAPEMVEKTAPASTTSSNN